jgi:hypothetical protein
MQNDEDIAIKNKDLTNKVFYVDNITDPPIVNNVKCLGSLIKKEIKFDEKALPNKIDETQKEKMSSVIEQLKTKFKNGGKKRKTIKRRKNKKRKTINKRRK